MNTQANDKFSTSVIVPTYNRSQQLTYTLKSLVNQTLGRSDYEVVVVDDGSSDDTFQVVKSFENQINIKYVYQTDRGYRVSSARNLGIRVADGKFCMFIDSGIIVKSDCLAQHLNGHHQQNNEVAIIGYTYGWGADETALNRVINPNDADGSIAKLVEMKAIFDIRENIFHKYNYQIENMTVPWTLFYGGHLSIRRTSLFEVGLFDENYDGNWGAEDQDLGYRLHLVNKKIVLCRKAAVLHLPSPSDSKAKEKQGYENCKYFNQKFQTFESQLFFDAYANDVSLQITHKEVLDFHELIINAQQP
ncbi:MULTISPECIES: glycosyltransferase [unclassified Microcoleus]|uniref:glycosyltransferase n=1 Tax=unclassified Microcoleus TaxID=2642155 RepID=UPI002FD472B6